MFKYFLNQINYLRDIVSLKLDFNLDFNNLYNNIVYLDNAATSLTPNQVIKKEAEYYKKYKSNIHRGLYKTAEIATGLYDESREVMAKFLNVKKEEIVWTSGATQGSNMLMSLFENNYLSKRKTQYQNKNEIVVIEESHHSELVPIQEFCNRNNIVLKFGIENINNNTILISCPMVSNVTGKIFGISEISKKAKENNAYVFCDLSAAVGHIKVDLDDLDIDAGYFSVHKMFGPTGVGVLYMKRSFSRQLKPVSFGGGMVWEVEKNKTSYRSDIEAFEAGTPNISGIIATSEAVKYISRKNIKSIHLHNKILLDYALNKFKDFNIKHNNIINIYTEYDINKNVGTISFSINNIHSHDVAQILADNNIAVRSGHHCAKIMMDKCEEQSMVRISFHLYNTKKHIDMFFDNLEKVLNIML